MLKITNIRESSELTENIVNLFSSAHFRNYYKNVKFFFSSVLTIYLFGLTLSSVIADLMILIRD